MSRVARILFLASVTIGGWSSNTSPCSCVSAFYPHPLLKSGAIVPADARGIPWTDIRNAKRWEISVKRLDRRSPPVPFKIETVEYPMGYALLRNGYADQKLSLVCPEWEAGGTYRVTVLNESIDVTVSSQRFQDEGSSIDIWQDEHGQVKTVTLRGSCSVTFPAHRLGIEMTGATLDRWGGALVYFTIVDDDSAWRPVRELCAPKVWPGESWVGTAQELLYCGCWAEGQRYDDSRDATYILSTGEHKVTMIGWLPGVTHVTATTTVSLACE